MENISSVAVVGLGYIGLPTAAILATQGIQVVGVDVDLETVDSVNKGEVTFVEPDLATYLAGAVSRGHLRATTVVPHADAYIVAVPTPFDDSHEPDLCFVDRAIESIAATLVGGELIILESTSPPGTTAHLARRIEALRPDLVDGSGNLDAYLAHCPERVLPGTIMVELTTNDRVIGGHTPRAAARAKSLYETFCRGEILLTDAKTAEMTKLVENAYRDVNIAFANEVSMIADRLEIDPWTLISLANHHPRVDILRPGPGVGGHCIAVDPWFIIAADPQRARLIRTAREVNDAKPAWVVEKLLASLRGVVTPRVLVLGLAFKADVDDLRESPAVHIVELLASSERDLRITVVEPRISELPQQLAKYGRVSLSSLEDALEGSRDAVLLLVDHQEFSNLAESLAPDENLVDTRGLVRRTTTRRHE